MIMYKIVSWVLVFGIMGLFGVELDMQQPSTKKDFLIVKSTKSYKEAESFAGKLAIRMDMKYMKEVQFNKETGLTHSKKMCAWSIPAMCLVDVTMMVCM